MQNPADRRCEPRLSAGKKVNVLSRDGTVWKTSTAFTVNVSDSGILVSMTTLLRSGDRVRIQSCESPECWTEAIVRHVIPGRVDYLTGMQFLRKSGEGSGTAPAVKRQSV